MMQISRYNRGNIDFVRGELENMTNGIVGNFEFFVKVI